jgi:hypothetical protein
MKVEGPSTRSRSCPLSPSASQDPKEDTAEEDPKAQSSKAQRSLGRQKVVVAKPAADRAAVEAAADQEQPGAEIKKNDQVCKIEVANGCELDLSTHVGSAWKPCFCSLPYVSRVAAVLKGKRYSGFWPLGWPQPLPCGVTHVKPCWSMCTCSAWLTSQRCRAP